MVSSGKVKSKSAAVASVDVDVAVTISTSAAGPYLLYFSPPPSHCRVALLPSLTVPYKLTSWAAQLEGIGQRKGVLRRGSLTFNFLLTFGAPFGHFGTYSAKASGSDLSAQPKNDYS